MSEDSYQLCPTFFVCLTPQGRQAHLGRDIFVKVPCILWVPELRFEGRLPPVNIVPVDSFEPRVRLRSLSRREYPSWSQPTAASSRSRESIADRRTRSTHDAFPGSTAQEHGDCGRFGSCGGRVKQIEERTSQLSSRGCPHSTGTYNLTLICSTPSILAPPPPPIWPKNPLRRTLTISELGRLVETVDWLPSLSSGSQSKRCMRSTPSFETRGRDGNRNACLQLRIF